MICIYTNLNYQWVFVFNVLIESSMNLFVLGLELGARIYFLKEWGK